MRNPEDERFLHDLRMRRLQNHDYFFDDDDQFVERDYLLGGVSLERDDFEGDFHSVSGRSRAEFKKPIIQNSFQNKQNFYGKGPKGWKYSDERIRDEVCEALYKDPEVDASDIEVMVNEGVVTLRGSIDSREAKRAAELCVEKIKSVQDIQNEIRVKRSEDILNEMLGNSG